MADKETVRFGEHINIMKCLKCGLIQAFPMKEISYEGYSEKIDFIGQKRKLRVSKYLPKLLGRKNKAKMEILEVGCGHGDNLKYLYEKGYHTVHGIDKDPMVCKKNASVLNLDWKLYNYWGLDAVYGIHLLEHISDPRKFMLFIKHILKNKGKFIFEIPCVEDPLIKLYKIKAYNKFCWYPYHAFFYSKESIRSVLFGFKIKVIRRQEYGIINHLRWAIRGKPGNWNPHIPILDSIYKWILCKLGYSDSLIVVGENV